RARHAGGDDGEHRRGGLDADRPLGDAEEREEDRPGGEEACDEGARALGTGCGAVRAHGRLLGADAATATRDGLAVRAGEPCGPLRGRRGARRPARRDGRGPGRSSEGTIAPSSGFGTARTAYQTTKQR